MVYAYKYTVTQLFIGSKSMEFKPHSQNPLAKHFRQPAIYLKLPSQGSYWAEGTIELAINGEIGILPMSTKDEITLKTPDALINGQGVVSVIESCCPSIKDAWAAPSIDVDSLLISIRIASYGNAMDVESVCPHCQETSEYTIDLGNVLQSIKLPSYNKKVEIESLKIKLKPAPYYAVNRANQITFEEQQILKSLVNIADDENAAAEFDKHLAKLITLSIENLSYSTDYIELDDGTIVNNPEHLAEFYQNCDTKVIKAIRATLAEFDTEGSIKSIPVNCTSCTKEFQIDLTFDYASFFAEGS
jgi:hypothetical protein